MFREMMRKKQALSEEECRQLLLNEKRGVLSVKFVQYIDDRISIFLVNPRRSISV